MTPEEYLDFLRKYNDFIYECMLKSPGSYSVQPRKKTDEELADIVNRRSKFRAKKIATKVHDVRDIIRGQNGKTNPFHYEGSGNEDIANLLFDYHYLVTDNKVTEQAIREKNKQTEVDIKDPEKRFRLIEDRLHDMMNLDISRMMTGPMDERMDYIHHHISAAACIFQMNDFIKAYESYPERNEDFLELFKEKSAQLELAGGIINYAEVLSSPYYELLDQMNSADMTQLVMTDISYRMVDDNNAVPEDKWIEDFVNGIKHYGTTLVSVEEAKEKEAVYQVLTDNFIFGTDDDALRYYPTDEKGNKIGLASAIDAMHDGRKITFVERTQEMIEYLMGKGDKPEKTETGASLTFTGAELTSKIDAPSPVIATLKKFENVYDEIEAAEKWFDSAAEVFAQAGIDLNNKYDVFRIKSIDLGGPDRRFITSEERFVGNPDMVSDTSEISSVDLNSLGKQDKLRMFRLARNGQLVLNDATMNVLEIRGIYVKDDGTAGLSEKISSMTTDNNFLYTEAALDKDYYKKMFPGASNAKELSIQYGDYARARAYEVGVNNNVDDVKRAKIRAERQYEAMILSDNKAHPEFYDNENDAKAREELIENYVHSINSEENPEWEELKTVSEEHPIDYYDSTVEKIMAKAKAEDRDLTFEQLLDQGYITREAQGNRTDFDIYAKKEGDHPWDRVDRLNNDIFSGQRNVFLTIPGEDGMKEYLIVSGGEDISFKEAVPQKLFNDTAKSLRTLCDKLMETGITRGDSPEIKALRGTLLNKLQNLSALPSEFKKDLEAISKAAESYTFAKADQSMNNRRQTRYEIAHQIRNIADSIAAGHKPAGPEDVYKHIIAEKTAKQLLKTVAASKNREAAENASNILGDPKGFKAQVENVKKSEKFSSQFEGKYVSELQTLSRSSGKNLAKTCLGNQKNKAEDLIKEQNNTLNM